MRVIDLPVASIRPADWNPNRMDAAMRGRLRTSIERFGIIVPLVVRAIGEGLYETVGGAQRLAVLMEMGADTALCVVVTADDIEARVLAQVLNHIAGQDDAVLRTELLRQVIGSVSVEELHELLPEAKETLRQIASLGAGDLGPHMRDWQRRQDARLKHLTLQLTARQLSTVERALVLAEELSGKTDTSRGGKSQRGVNPNRRGNAVYAICRFYVENAAAYTGTYTQKENK